MPPARSSRPSFALAALATLVALAACMPGPLRPPSAPVRGRLAPGALAGPVPLGAAGPLRVAFAAPRGETTQAAEISLVFSEPMRPLGLGPHDPPPPVVMTPEVPGRWQWIGSSALRFNAAAPLPAATPLRVEVPACTRALDGDALAEPFVLEFSTPRPALTGSEPAAGADGIPPGGAISLWLSQPVDAAELSRATSIRAGEGAPIPFTVEPVEGGGDGGYRLIPQARLPLDAEIRVRIDASLRGREGLLPMGKDAEIRFRTAGPLAIAGWSCAPHPVEAGACDPEDSTITLKLTNPVPVDAVTGAVSVHPPLDIEAWPVIEDDADAAREYTVSAPFEPGKAYRLKLAARPGRKPIADIHGQALSGGATRELRFGDLPPAVYLGAWGTYWEASASKALPVRTRNVAEASVTAAPLGRPDVLAWLADPERRFRAAEPERRFTAGVGKRNEESWSRTSLDDLLGNASARGPVLVRTRASAPGLKAPLTRDRLFQLTDLGTVARAGEGGAALWVTRLRNGAPVAGATVEAYRVRGGAPAKAALEATSTTDANGLAWLPLGPTRAGSGALALFVRHGDDWTFHDLGAPKRPAPVGIVSDERGIYRPGEEVHLMGAIRVPGPAGLTTPSGREVDVKVEDPDGKQVIAWKLRLSAFGTFAKAAPIGENAPLGRYKVSVTLDGAPAAVDWFSVDEYVPASATADARVDSIQHRRGDTMTCALSGKYLYGAPMAGAAVTVVVTRGSGWHEIPGLDTYTLRDQDGRVPSVTLARATATLDARGAFRLPVALAFPGQTSTESVTCRAEILDHNRQAYSAEAGSTVHPADVYVALEQDQRWSIRAGESWTQRALVVTPEGARRSRPVHIELIRREGASGGSPRDTTIATCAVTPGLEPAGCKLTAPTGKPGDDDQLVVRATVQDERGDTSVASYTMRLEPPPEPPKPQPPAPPPAPRPPPDPYLEVHTDSGVRKVGEVAKVRVYSPYRVEARALLTVEREGILERRLLTLPPHAAGPLTVELPVTQAMIPSADVHVVAISGASSEQRGTRIEVDPASRALALAVRPSCARCAPGDSVNLEVEAKDAAGRPAAGVEITLWGADQGSLEVGRYRPPAPMAEMFAWRPSLVVGHDVRDDLVRTGMFGSHRTRPPQIRMGSTSVTGRRADFRQTVLFASGLRTDASGRVKRRVRLPDGLTEYRFFALAIAADDRFGVAKASLTTSKPLMARPSLPRVIRAGDQLEASVVVSTQDLPPGRVTVAARAEGLTPLGPPRRAVDLAPGEPQELRFPFRADRPGRARLAVDAKAPAPKGKPAPTDGVDLSREVVSPAAIETAAISGEAASAIAEQLGDLAGLRPDVGGVTLSLSATPLAALAPGIEQLLEYPYGCTEQTVSRMVPLLALRDLAESLGVALPEGELGEPGAPKPPTGALAAALAAAVARVAANQRPDGGYGYWPGSSSSDPWLTAYARWGLGEARRRGVPVPARALDGAMKYLEAILVAVAPDRTATDEQLAIAALIVDLLAVEGSPDALRAEALFAERARLPRFARALLLHALAVGQGDAASIQELTREIEATARIDGPLARIVVERGFHDASLLDSDARTTAMALRALSAAAPEHRLIAPLARGLLADRRGARWRTTQEAAWALIGLDAYRKAHPPPAAPLTARVFLGDALLTEAALGAPDPAKQATLTLPMERLISSAGAPLVFAPEGQGRLHYEATLRFARRGLPTEPVEAGFFVQKTLRPASAPPGAPGLGVHESPCFRAGEVVIAEIEIVTPSPRRGVLVEDPLPGGLEPVNLSHRAGGSWLADLERGQGWATRRELRDDRVVYVIDELPAGITRFRYLTRAITPGSFVAPPTRVEEMYAPETYGATAAGTVRVERP